MAWTTPPTFSAGATLTAAQLNILGGDLTQLGSAWTNFTPTINTGGVGITLGNGTLEAAYNQLGKFVMFHIGLTIGSTTTMTAGTVAIFLPAAATSTTAGHAVGTFTTVAPIAMGAWRNVSTTTVNLFLSGATAAATVASLGLVAGTSLILNGTYEAA